MIEEIAFENIPAHVIHLVEARDEMGLVQKFDEIEESMPESNDQESLKFLQSFIDEVNSK